MARLICFLGTQIEATDALPLSLIERIKEEFPEDVIIHYDPTEELESANTNRIILIDTVMGIDSITVFASAEHFLLSPRVSVHDYDLPLTLGLLRKLGKLPEVKIIGIPPGVEVKTLPEKITSLLQSI